MWKVFKPYKIYSTISHPKVLVLGKIILYIKYILDFLLSNFEKLIILYQTKYSNTSNYMELWLMWHYTWINFPVKFTSINKISNSMGKYGLWNRTKENSCVT